MESEEEIQQRKLQELRAKIEEQQRREIQKRLILQQILTPGARSRLSNVRMAKPEFAEQVELQLIQLAQAGRLTSKITDAQLREILDRLRSRRPEFRIRRK